MHEWLLRLTLPEDHILWIWVAIAASHGALGLVLGLAWDRLRTPGVGPTSR